MAIAQFRIIDTARAFYFITEHDIDHTWTSVDIDTLTLTDVERFYTAVLINVLDADPYQDALDALEARMGITTGGGGTGIAGHVSIVDVTPTSTGNVGSKVLSQDNHRLESAVSDTPLVRVHIVAVTGPTNYKPNVTVNDISVPLTEDSDMPLWNGYVDISVPESGLVLAEHEDGASDAAVITVESAPVISSATFINGYPLGQTELKENDVFSLSVTADKEFTRIDILDAGAGKYSTHNFAAATTQVITLTVANRGNVATMRGASVIVYDENGSASATYLTASAGSADGVNVVNVNNLHPTIIFGAPTYPVGQEALKGTEQADVPVTYNNTDTILFDSPNNQLGIVDASVIETPKTVSRINGSYNVTSNNLRATGTRTANGATSSSSTIIQIANIAPNISVSTTARLRSGGNQGTSIQNHTVTLTSNQRLLNTPTLDNTPGGGTFIGSWVGGPSVYNRTIQVHDDDTKGTYNFINFSATNLANIPITLLSGSNQYILGGFVSRDIYFSPIQNQEPIGTNVTDTSKLVALDKDLIPMTYQSSLGDGVRRYTITGPLDVLNSSGTILFWADQTEVDNNTTGGAFIRIEETV